MAAFFRPQTEELSGQHWYGISYLRLSKLGKRYESESIHEDRSITIQLNYADPFAALHPYHTLAKEAACCG